MILHDFLIGVTLGTYKTAGSLLKGMRLKRLILATSLFLSYSLVWSQNQTPSRNTPSKTNIASKSKASAKGKVKSIKKVSVSKIPQRPSFGQLAGLHDTLDTLSLKSSVAYVIDQETQEILLSKNDQAVLPIASITKLMTGVIVRESNLSMDEPITISQEDVDTEKGSRSRLMVGATLSRGELLHLALMASENRAAHALGRSHPGGLSEFVKLMNTKATQIGMKDTFYVEPTGLSSKNQSSAKDLATLVGFAYNDLVIRDLSTSSSHAVSVGNKTLQYKTTNNLVSSPNWDIGLQKTGYISEAGQCLVMQAKIAGRKLIMVFLDSAGRFSRIADAERVRKWVETYHSARING